MTQKQLSVALNMAASTLGNYIRNVREPDHATLKSLADYFGVTTDYLLNHQTPRTANHAEQELVRIFRALPHDQQEIYLAQGRAF